MYFLLCNKKSRFDFADELKVGYIRYDYTTIQRMTIPRLTKWRPDFDILMIQRLFFFEKKAKIFFLPLTGFT